MTRNSVVALFLLAALAFVASGCLVVAGRSFEEAGIPVTQKTLGQIELGVTTEAWIVATLGVPTDQTVVEGQGSVKILRYDHTVTRREGSKIFLLVALRSKTRTTTHTFFEITDGVVTRHWTEA